METDRTGGRLRGRRSKSLLRRGHQGGGTGGRCRNQGPGGLGDDVLEEGLVGRLLGGRKTGIST